MSIEIIKSTSSGGITQAVHDTTLPLGNTTTIGSVSGGLLPQAVVGGSNPDVLGTVLAQPWIYLVVVMAIVGYVVVKLKGKDKKPEQQFMWGRKVMKHLTKETMTNRNKIWGMKTKYTIYKGMQRIGKVLKVQHDIRVSEKDKVAYENEYLNISFREFGFWSWFKAVFLQRYEHLLCDPSVIKLDQKQKHIMINPKAFIVENSGVWVVATKKEMGLIEEFWKQDVLEETLGQTADFTRRLANQSASVAAVTEKMITEEALKEQSRQAKIKDWAGGK